MASITVNPSNLSSCTNGSDTSSSASRSASNVKVFTFTKGPGYSKFSSILPNTKAECHEYVNEEWSRSSKFSSVVLSGEECTNESTPLNFKILVDASGSMNGERIKIVKCVTETLIESTLMGKDHVSIDTFASEKTEIVPKTLITTSNLKTLLEKNNKMSAGGQTNMGCALIPALQSIQDVQNPEQTMDNVLIVLSDGGVNSGRSGPELVEYVNKMNNIGASCYVIGIGSGIEEDFLQKFATALGGTFSFTTGGDDSIATVIGSIMGGERGIVEKDTKIKVKCGDHTAVVFSGPFKEKERPTTNTWKFSLRGNLQEKEKKMILFAGNILETEHTGYNANSKEDFSVVMQHNVANDAANLQSLQMWLNFRVGQIMEHLLKTFDSNYDEGKKMVDIALHYLYSTNEKALGVGIDKQEVNAIFNEKETEIKKLKQTKSKSDYTFRARKSAVAYHSSTTMMRSVNTGGKRKQRVTEEFTRTVRGKGQ